MHAHEPDLDAPDAAARHAPVLPQEVLMRLQARPGARLLDLTLGLGGHAELLLRAGASVLGVDRDAAARELASARLAPFGDRFHCRAGCFAAIADELSHAAARDPAARFDGVLADLGVSSMQLDEASRGFSLRADVRADMRMDSSRGEDASALIDRLDETALADVIFRYGEERLSRRIARALKTARANGSGETAAQLAAAIRAVVPGHQPRHPALRTFQALRIAVNDELGELERLLQQLPGLLVPGGTAVLISFHSLEDRLIKHDFRLRHAAGDYAEIARAPETASAAELLVNPRAASAKLRYAVRAGDSGAAVGNRSTANDRDARVAARIAARRARRVADPAPRSCTAARAA